MGSDEVSWSGPVHLNYGHRLRVNEGDERVQRHFHLDQAVWKITFSLTPKLPNNFQLEYIDLTALAHYDSSTALCSFERFIGTSS